MSQPEFLLKFHNAVAFISFIMSQIKNDMIRLLYSMTQIPVYCAFSFTFRIFDFPFFTVHSEIWAIVPLYVAWLDKKISFPREAKYFAVANSCLSGGLLSCEISILPNFSRWLLYLILFVCAIIKKSQPTIC